MWFLLCILCVSVYMLYGVTTDYDMVCPTVHSSYSTAWTISITLLYEALVSW
jgi:hypothetical protein